MTVRFFCPRWGAESEPWPDFCARVKDAGYDGVETSLPLGDATATDAILGALERSGLALIAQHWETVTGQFDRHREEYIARLEWLAAAKPLFINSQTGRDWFTFGQNRDLIEAAHGVAARTGVAIHHETHRGKFAYSAAVTLPFLQADPRLTLSADFSHWCVVSESLLDDQEPALDAAIARTAHLHTRVGHPEGPQVSDPRAPEWSAAFEAHLGWWDRVVERHRKAGTAVLTVTPEFGPAPYMPALPYTAQPVADQWGVNAFMREFLHRRWG